MKTTVPDLVEAMPPKVRVGHLDYRLEWVVNLRDDDGTRLMGCFLNLDLKIQIDPSMSGPLIADTLFHELTHAFFEAHGIPRKRLDEEQVAMALGCAWAQFAQANPGVLKRIGDFACA